MEEMLKLLNRTNNEAELFEDILEHLAKDEMGLAKMKAARILARRDMLFDIEKITKENEQGNNSGIRNEVSGETEAKS